MRPLSNHTSLYTSLPPNVSPTPSLSLSSSSHLRNLLRLHPLKRLTPRRTIFHINLRIRLGLLLIHSSALDEHDSWHSFDISDHDCGAFAAVFVVHALAGVARSGEEEVGAGELFELYRMKRLVHRGE